MNDTPVHARSLRRTLLASALCAGATAQNATSDPPPLTVEYLSDGAWLPTPPGQSGYSAFRVVASTAAGVATGTWWVPLALVHVQPGSMGEAYILGGHPEFAFLLDTVPQPYPPLASVVGASGAVSQHVAAAEWSLPHPWVLSLTELVFAGSAAGSNVDRWCVPTWNPDGDPAAASPFFHSHWWDPQNFWSELVQPDSHLINQDAALQVMMQIAAGGALPPDFFGSEDYLRLYKSLAIRLQMVGYRDDNVGLASYPKQPLMLPPPIGTDPPPKLPSGPSQFKITIGTPGEWVTAGTRPGFNAATQQPPTYPGTVGQPLVMAFVGFVPHTMLHLRSIAAGSVQQYAVEARWAGPGRIRIQLDVDGGHTYEVWRVSSPFGESDLVGGERARIRVP
jgi:hypothetical protein